MSMMPNDPLVGGVALRRPAIQSPNFVSGSTGWTINADGSVEFNNGVFRGTVTAGTIIGSLIESASSGRRTTLDSNGDIKVYNASGAVLFWFQNSTNCLFLYTDTGSASQGVLYLSISDAGGTDPFGATFYPGVVTYSYSGGRIVSVSQVAVGEFAIGVPDQMSGSGGATPGGTALAAEGEVILSSGKESSADTIAQITLTSAINSSNVPNVALNGTTLSFSGSNQPGSFVNDAILYSPNSSNGLLKFVDGNAGALWQLGANTFFTTGTQTFSSNSLSNISGLSAPNLGPGTYRILARVWFQPSGTIGGTHFYQFAFSGAGSANLNGFVAQAGSAFNFNYTAVSSFGLASSITSPTHAAFPGFLNVEGILTVTSAGTLNVQCAVNTPGDNVTNHAGSILEVRPLP